MLHAWWLASLALEAAALGAVLGGLEPLGYVLHVASALVGARWAVQSLRPAFERPALAFPLFVAVLVSFPVVGLPGLTIGLLAPLRRPRVPSEQRGRSTTTLLPEQAFHPEPGVLVRSGGIPARRRARDVARRAAAVGATRGWPDADALPLLREALRDPADEVRLPAYALLQQRERRAAERVRRCEDELVAHPSPRAHLRAAEARLALVVDAHAQGTAATQAADAALAHCDEGLRITPDEPHLHFVRGRSLLARGAPGAAQTAFQAALLAGLPLQILAPYLAKARFESRSLARSTPASDDARDRRRSG